MRKPVMTFYASLSLFQAVEQNDRGQNITAMRAGTARLGGAVLVFS